MDNKNIIIIVLLIIILIGGGLLTLKILTVKSVEEGMNYAEEKSIETRNKMDIKYEKENISLAIDLARMGNNTIEELTYEKFNEQLKEVFKDEEYTLDGPDGSGTFTIKINDRTYKIDKDGKFL